MGFKKFLKRLFHRSPKSRHFRFTVTFKSEIEDNTNDPAWILKANPITVDDEWCYNFRKMLTQEVTSISFLDQHDKTTTKTYPCTMQATNHVVFINNPPDPKQYGKILIIIPKIDIVESEKRLNVLAEVGNFNRTISGSYSDYSMVGQTVTFDIKYRRTKDP